MLRSTKTREQKGFVIVLGALSLMGVVLVMGFAVDLGTWYLRATQLQRAADAAALAGAVSLPNTDEAQNEIKSTFEHNGFADTASINITASASDSTVTASVVDKKVPTYFVHSFMKSISLKRSSSATKSIGGIPLGSPFNVFGSGSLALAGSDGVPKQNFWAAISGPCSAKEDGDYFSAMWDFNEPESGTVCGTAGGGKVNPDYNPAGYGYTVTVPAGQTNPVDVDIWDPSFVWIFANTASPDILGGVDADTKQGDMNTYYALFDATAGDNPADWKVVGQPQMWLTGDYAPATKWRKLATIPAGNTERKYVVQVFTRGVNEGGDTGTNAFSLLARPTTDADPTSGATPVACDTRKHPDTCPSVSGRGAVSAFNNVQGTTDFFLAALNAGYSGSDVTMYLWDPGEGAQSIEFLPPTVLAMLMLCHLIGQQVTAQAVRVQNSSSMTEV